jgi:hypothetical protein
MIEEWPPSKNPYQDRVGDVISSINLNLARKTAQLAGIALCSLAGIMADGNAPKLY